MPDVPLVYVETNWIVSTFFRHREKHGSANSLLASAKRGECEIRIPHAALIEARYALDSESNRVQNLVTQISKELATAFRHGATDLDAAVNALKGTSTRSYLATKPDQHINTLKTATGVHLIHDAATEIDELEKIRDVVRLRGVDKFDLYILAAMVANRSKESAVRPAIFFSENTKEFEPKTDSNAKMPADLYKKHGIVFRSDYDVGTALILWKKSFAVI